MCGCQCHKQTLHAQMSAVSSNLKQFRLINLIFLEGKVTSHSIEIKAGVLHPHLLSMGATLAELASTSSHAQLGQCVCKHCVNKICIHGRKQL